MIENFDCGHHRLPFKVFFVFNTYFGRMRIYLFRSEAHRVFTVFTNHILLLLPSVLNFLKHTLQSNSSGDAASSGLGRSISTMIRHDSLDSAGTTLPGTGSEILRRHSSYPLH